MEEIKYIELFSGIGAFSQAIKKVNKNSKCLFAADINVNCSEVYKLNYKIDSLCDITKKSAKDIPDHNFCFFSPPCQAFSKGGKQKGFEEARGTLIYDVFRILEVHHPKYILMENVRNLVSHDDGNTIEVINASLKKLGYRIPQKPLILSPHQFGVPQFRERAFLPGIYDPENVDKELIIDMGKLLRKEDNDIYSIVDPDENNNNLYLTEKEKIVLDAWDEFYHGIDVKTIGFPIWFDYFNADADTTGFPGWKLDFVRKNRELYERNKEFIDTWSKKYNVMENFNSTQRKFEWQCGEKVDSIKNALIQSRPSGIRVKCPTVSPALVAMVHTSIIGKYERRFSIKECLRLQSFPDSFRFGNQTEHDSYRQLGNSINVKVLAAVIKKLLNYRDDYWNGEL